MDFRDEKKEALINIAMVYLSGVRDYRLSPRGQCKSCSKIDIKKAERLLDESVRTGIVEYHFSVDGIEIISQLWISKKY